MSLRAKVAKGSLFLSLGEGIGYGAAFVRNMILARLLSKSDFGVAVTLGMAVTLFEFASKLGMARFVVQDKEGSRPEFVAAAHTLQGVVGLLGAAMITATAPLLAQFFGLTGYDWAFALLGLVAALRGFEHLDVRRYERDLRFAPSVLVETIPQLLITVVAWPVALWCPDYRAVLLLFIFKTLATCLGSHWLAEQPYRWRWHREFLTRMLRFGWPVVVTSLLMIGVTQGDKFLVARYYSMADLASYAAAFALLMAPTFMVGRIFNSISLPVLAHAQDDTEDFNRRYRLLVALVGVFAASYAAGLILGAESIMRLVYGEKYSGSGLILAWLASGNAFRNIRIAPTIAALARGDSINSMASNVARVFALVPAFVLALYGQPLWTIAGTGLLGEAWACGVSFRRLSRLHGVSVIHSLRPTVLITLVVALAGAGVVVGAHRLTQVLSLVLAVVGAGIAGLAVALVLEDCRRPMQRLWYYLKDTGWRAVSQLLRNRWQHRKPASF